MNATDAFLSNPADHGAPEAVRASPLPRWATVTRNTLLLAILFVASGWVAKQLAIPPDNVTMLWLPSGVAVGAVLLYGRWMWPGILFGSFVLNTSLGMSMGSDPSRAATLALFTATGATLQALLADALVRHRFGDRVELSRPRDVAMAVLLGVLIPALFSSTVGHVALALLRDYPLARVAGSMATWALGDALGILMVAPFAMIGERRRLRALWHGKPVRGLFGFIALGCGLGLALTLFAWINARERLHERGQTAFAALTVESEQALRSRLRTAAQSLDGAAGLFAAGERVTWPEWITYSKVIDIERTQPGIDDIGFIKLVRRSELAVFQAEAARDGLPIPRLHRLVPDGDHYVVKYIYPLEPNRAVLGLDTAFDPKRREAADQARDSGRAIVTRPIRFIQYRGPGLGFTMLRPVYASTRPPRTVAERRRTFIGWAYHPFTAQDFFGGLTQRQGADFDLRIRTPDSDGRSLAVFDSAAAARDRNAHRSAFVAARTFEAAGRRWELEWRSTAQFEQRVESSEPLLVLLTGLSISLALAAVLIVVARREALVTREVERATAELSEANRLLLMTEATSHVGHWRYDMAAGTMFWSEEVYRIHGRPPGAPVTRNLALGAFHRDDRDRVWQSALDAVKNQGEFELRTRIVRPDGDTRHLALSGRVEQGATGRPVALFGVIQDVTSETRVREQLLKARDAAQEAARIRGAFLANLSHEIRTPMNGVIGFAELLLETRLTTEQRTHVEIIAESGTSMMSLLNDVLDLSKIEAGYMELASEPVALDELANSAMRMLVPSLRKRDVWLELQIDPDLPPRVMGDTLRLRQVLLNLLGNAVKFTEEGFIRLEIVRVGEQIRFAVIDSGVGIPPDRIGDIFNSFVQLDPVARAAGSGTGLGLTICNSLVRVMGGRLNVSSRPGEGSTFHFTLPCVAAPEGVAPESQIGGSVPGLPASPTTATPHRPQPAAGARILLAEDNEINQALIRTTAARLGLILDVVGNGAEAIERTEQAIREGRPYDLILMDVQMPVLDGISATERLRAAGHGPHTLPIVALSANVYQSDIDACLGAGMQAHLPKPVRREALEQAIATWMRRPANGADPFLHASAAPPPAEPLPASLIQRYAERRAALAESLRTFDLAAAEDARKIAGLLSEIHKLAGTAGHFDDDEAGEAARHAERGMIDANPRKRIALAQALLGVLESSSIRITT